MSLLLTLLFGVIGSSYVLYGWRERDTEFLVSGFVLVIYPYLLSNVFVIALLGALATVAPIGRRKGWF